MTKLEQRKNVWFSSNFREKILEKAGKESNIQGSFNEWRTPRYMNDSTIQKESKTTAIPVNDFLALMDQNLDSLDKSKWYIVHVQNDSQCIAVSVDWCDVVWRFGANEFDRGHDWHEGGILLFFATATHDTENQTLESAIQMCKDNGLVVYKPL